MIKPTLQKILIIILFIPLLGSCKKKADNFDIDLSNFKPTNNNLKIDKQETKEIQPKQVINKLLPLKKRDEVSALIKYEKKDPFSMGESNDSKKLISNFQIKGFISIQENHHALVNYEGKTGFININSVGGLNTEMLPKEAYVKDIIPSQEKINLSVEGEIYTFELNL